MALFRPTYADKKTGELKKSAVWWYDFIFAGKRIRESAKTTSEAVAGEAEKRRRLELEKCSQVRSRHRKRGCRRKLR